MRMRPVLSNRPVSALDAGAPRLRSLTSLHLERSRSGAVPGHEPRVARVVYRRRALEDWVHAHLSRQHATTALPEVRPLASHP